MATQHREHYRITASDETDRALASVKRGFEQVESAVSAVGRATAGLAGIAASAMAFGHFVRGAAEAERETTRLTAVLRATGFAAGYTREQLEGMALALADRSIFEDGHIKNAQSELLKFGNIAGDVFKRAMDAAADFASFTGGDIQSAAQTIGKALQAPEEGVGALERQIGRLSDAQKENIKEFMAQGRVAEAQRVILDALSKRIGGTTELINTGLTKSLNDLGKAWNDFGDALGGSVGANRVLGAMASFLRDMKATIESGDWTSTLKDLFIIGSPIMGRAKIPSQPSSVTGIIRGGPQDPEVAARVQALQAEIDAAMAAARAKQGKGGKGKPTDQGMSFDELMARAAMKRAQMQDEANERAEKAAEDLRKENERLLESVIDLIDPTAQYTRQIETYRKAMEDGVISVEQFIEAATVLQGKITEIRERNQQVKEETKAVDDVARDLGLTFTSAFEDAIVQGKELREVMRGLLMDIAKIAVRKTVTEPIGGAISGLVKAGLGKVFGGGGGGWTGSGDMDLPSFDGGGFTGGGSRSGGVDGRGGFLSVLHPGETVIDHRRGQSASGGTYYIDARGADVSGLARLEAMIRSLNGSIERRAVAAVSDHRFRAGVA